MKKKKSVGVGFGVMILKNNKVLLGHRHEDPEKADSELEGAGKWTMPGGKLEFGELFEEGAKREVMEETGMELKDVSVICINNDIIETAHFITIGMFAEEFEGEPKVMEPDEITEWKWFDIDNLPEPMFFPSTKILENYRQGKFYLS